MNKFIYHVLFLFLNVKSLGFGPAEMELPKVGLAQVVSEFESKITAKGGRSEGFFIQKIEFVARDEINIFHSTYKKMKQVKNPSKNLAKFLKIKDQKNFWVIICYEKEDVSQGIAYVYYEKNFISIASRE